MHIGAGKMKLQLTDKVGHFFDTVYYLLLINWV